MRRYCVLAASPCSFPKESGDGEGGGPYRGGEALFCHSYTHLSKEHVQHRLQRRTCYGMSWDLLSQSQRPPCRHLKALWWLMSSKCVTALWLQQNQVMHEGVELMQASCTQELRQTIFRQLRALRKIRGAKLKLCLELLEVSPREAPQQEMGRMQPPGSVETPALITAYYT
ncbi:hypothetical protein JG687_00012230 [Phytophthora cactorum]|uniref:Uncharacterized protein n=1 Tax=Phytophthora cactorum TaxID=29920 RepID=A0A8T1U4X1_9STRA|nr:hypothetical protein JG687_00012230 [Phytophthora cactorum]